jgi:hypothetical protein
MHHNPCRSLPGWLCDTGPSQSVCRLGGCEATKCWVSVGNGPCLHVNDGTRSIRTVPQTRRATEDRPPLVCNVQVGERAPPTHQLLLE